MVAIIRRYQPQEVSRPTPAREVVAPKSAVEEVGEAVGDLGQAVWEYENEIAEAHALQTESQFTTFMTGLLHGDSSGENGFLNVRGLEANEQMNDLVSGAQEQYRRLVSSLNPRVRAATVRSMEPRFQTFLRQVNAHVEAEVRAARAAAASSARRVQAAEYNVQVNRLIRNPTEETLTELQVQYPEQAQRLVRVYDDARIQQNPGAVLEDIEAGRRDDVYAPGQFQDVIDSARRGVDRAEREQDAARNAALGELESTLAEETAYIEAIGSAPAGSYSTNPDALDETLEGLIPDPEQRSLARAAIDEQFAQANAIAEVASAPFDDIAGEVERLRARVEEPGNTVDDQADLNRYLTAVQRREESIAEDAAGHVTRTNTQLANYFSAIEGAASPTEASTAVVRYRSALVAEYDRLGVGPEARRILPAAAAQSIATNLVNAGVDTLPLQLAEVTSQWGPQVVRELEAAGLPSNAVVAARYADNPALATSIIGLRDQSRTELVQGLPSTTVSDVDARLEGELAEYRQAFETGDQTGQATQTFNEYYGVAERLVLTRLRQGNSVERAVSIIVEQMFPETPIVSSRMRVLVPETSDAQLVEAALDRALSDDMIRAFEPEPLEDPTFPEFANEELMIRAARDGTWLNNSDGTGAILAIDLGGYFLPVRNRSGAYYAVSYSDPSSLYEALRPALSASVDDQPIGATGFDFEAEIPVSP